MATRKTNEEYVKEVKDLVGDEYTFLEEYVNAKTNILVRHNKCGHEYKVVPNNFLRGTRFPLCYNRKRSKSLLKSEETFQKEVKDAVGDEYTFLEKYIGTNRSIKVKHNTCGHVWKIEPSNFLGSGHRCPVCARKRASKNRRYTNDEFLKKVALVDDGDDYLFLEEYTLSSQPIKVKHLLCDNEYSVSPNNFLTGRRCPRCNISKGESLIKNYLVSLKIDFEPEATFDNLRSVEGNNQRLRYDFAIKIEGSTFALIEFDGKQHFQPVERWGGEEAFIKTQERDKRKNDYAESNGIPLIRIKYSDIENIEAILNKWFEKIGLYRR